MKDGEGAYFYQIITEKDDSVKIAQVQNILEDSFFSADIILAEVSIDLQMARKIEKKVGKKGSLLSRVRLTDVSSIDAILEAERDWDK